MATPSPSSSVLERFLLETKCSSISFPHPSSSPGSLLVIDSEMTLADALEKLIEHRILSIPVVDPVTRRPIFIFSMQDLVYYLLNTISDRNFTSLPQKLKNLISRKSHEIHNMKLSDFHGKEVEPLVLIDEDANLMGALKMMLDRNAHRILVINKHGKIVSLITQSHLLSMIGTLPSESIPILSKSIASIPFFPKNVVTVKKTETSYSAFHKMLENKVDGLAVLNEQGKLVGSLSVSDIKLIGDRFSYFGLFGLSLKEYLKRVREDSEKAIRPPPLAAMDKPNSYFVITAKEDSTFGHVIYQMNHFKVHRVFVIDAELKPMGVISLIDVLQVVYDSLNTPTPVSAPKPLIEF